MELAAAVIDVVEHIERGGSRRHQDDNREGGEFGEALSFNLGGGNGGAKIVGNTESVVWVAVS